MNDNYILMMDKYKTLNDVTVEDLETFTKLFTNKLYVQSLIQGNLQQETVLAIMTTIMSALNCDCFKDVSIIYFKFNYFIRRKKKKSFFTILNRKLALKTKVPKYL